MNGYGGSILRVNLTEGSWKKESTPADLARDFIGGRGFGIYFLLKEVPRGADPLGADNKIFISSGPISGMMVPGGGKCDWTTKAPLTGGYASASMGGHFTAEMRYAGLDSIILEGISPKPVTLFIDNDKVELQDAGTLWGKGTFAVEKHFKEKLGEEFQVAVIGPGGENLVPYACVNHD
jgi:aldehyde:ferredoxin oxidoreductase